MDGNNPKIVEDVAQLHHNCTTYAFTLSALIWYLITTWNDVAELTDEQRMMNEEMERDGIFEFFVPVDAYRAISECDVFVEAAHDGLTEGSLVKVVLKRNIIH